MTPPLPRPLPTRGGEQFPSPFGEGLGVRLSGL